MGGFHKFAEASADAGHEVIFFSAARPYYIMFKHDERLNKKVLKQLSEGMTYHTEKGATVLNCTWPTFQIPRRLSRCLPHKLNQWLSTSSLGSFSSFQHKYLDNTDVFVFESCDGLVLFDKIKRYNPSSKFVYRPSDPLAVSGNEGLLKLEWHILKECDLSLLVNNESLALYREKYPDFDKNVRFRILPNGVDTEKFEMTYPVPAELRKDNTALYVGAQMPNWELLLYSAAKCPDINFVIVCPAKPSSGFLNSGLANITYVPGIFPEEVPAWVTNCDVVIVPYRAGSVRKKPCVLTAKYMQAMTARKRIVAFDDDPRLKTEYDIDVAYSFQDFVSCLNNAMSLKGKKEYIMENRDWAYLTKAFIGSLRQL